MSLTLKVRTSCLLCIISCPPGVVFVTGRFGPQKREQRRRRGQMQRVGLLEEKQGRERWEREREATW